MLRSRTKQPFGFAPFAFATRPFSSVRPFVASQHPPVPPLSRNFANQSPWRTIVSDRCDIVTKLIHRRYNIVGRRRLRPGVPRAKGPRFAYRYRSSKEKKRQAETSYRRACAVDAARDENHSKFENATRKIGARV